MNKITIENLPDKDTLLKDLKEKFEGTYKVHLSILSSKKNPVIVVSKNSFLGVSVTPKNKKKYILISGYSPMLVLFMVLGGFIPLIIGYLIIRKKMFAMHAEVGEYLGETYHGTVSHYTARDEKLVVFVMFFCAFILILLAGWDPRATQDKIDAPIQESQTSVLPTAFRTPTPDGPPYIVDAEIERITIPNCEGCYADIIKKIDGVSDDVIIQMNDHLTSSVFNGKDIRNSKNRILSNEIGTIDSFGNTILYVDKSVLSAYSYIEAYFEGAAHPTRDPGSYTIFDVSSGKDSFEDTTVFETYIQESAMGDKDKVLEYFYPNGAQLFTDYLENNDQPDSDNQTCYGDNYKFPSDFYPTVRPNTGEVVFSISFPYAAIGACSPGLEIAIPISDILREVPQYIPSNSVLWKFKEYINPSIVI